MPDFVICDNGIVDAKIVPPGLLASPGGCPPGIYHTFLCDHGGIVAAGARIEYFMQQLESEGQQDAPGLSELLKPQNSMELVKPYSSSNTRAKYRMMVFEEPQRLLDGQETQTLAFVQPAPPVNYSGPFRCAVAEKRRMANPGSNWATKCLGRSAIDADLDAARTRGFDDILYLDRTGRWCEGSYSNIVAVFGEKLKLIVNPGYVYPGITQVYICELEKELRPLQIEFAELHEKEIAEADEVFLTSAIRGFQPVTEIEGIGTWPLNPPCSVRAKIYEKLQTLNVL